MYGNIKMDVNRKVKDVDLIYLAHYKDRLWTVVKSIKIRPL
jgi:hypothetical protein